MMIPLEIYSRIIAEMIILYSFLPTSFTPISKNLAVTAEILMILKYLDAEIKIDGYSCVLMLKSTIGGNIISIWPKDHSVVIYFHLFCEE